MYKTSGVKYMTSGVTYMTSGVTYMTSGVTYMTSGVTYDKWCDTHGRGVSHIRMSVCPFVDVMATLYSGTYMGQL